MIDPYSLPDLPDLMIAGPGELQPQDLEVLGHQVIAHYGDIWTQLHQQTLDSLQHLLGSSSSPYMIPGTGTTCLEMAMLNLFEKGQKVLITDTGYFGDRLNEIASAIGLVTELFPVTTGEPVDVDLLGSTLRAHDGIITTHVETSTGVRHPIELIARVAHDVGAICMVDGIASAGGETVDIEQMQIDAFVTATQKGLEAPPGLGILAFSSSGRERVMARSARPESWFLDISVWDRYRDEWADWHPHPVTMPTNLVLALCASLNRMQSHGSAAWIESRRVLADRCRAGLETLGYGSVAADGCGANLVVAAWADDPARIQKFLLGAGLMISGGLGPTHGRAVRIGLMGRTATDAHVDRLLEALAGM